MKKDSGPYEIVGTQQLVAMGHPDYPSPDYKDDSDYTQCVVDTRTTPWTVLGRDGGEPEDQTLGRDWSWVVPALNAAARTGGA